ncbi:hypothetical protein HIM_11978 [Hirsutella minnesotensis 3608]|uniref:ubiquitinyl hydrolase 1 n=1 Tax=Hirsutella minnesotensis 3608 TaxID=1043627 RepID=A0A0F7ZQX7_9HYPO|nr:hypothetical protein HIM_11978 [Hirsutella minnesotensis 3608]
MDTVKLVFNHLVLPPKLPTSRDVDHDEVGAAILSRLVRACHVAQGESPPPSSLQPNVWSTIRRCLQNCSGIAEPRVEAKQLLQDWCALGLDDLCLVCIAEQNGAFLIRRETQNNDNFVIFEVFETCPSAKKVLASANSLEWDFPGRAARIPLNVFEQDSFQANLSRFLEQAANEPLHRFSARASKAGAKPVESRDTADPGLLVQFLMPILEATGHSIETPRLRKQVRDDVVIHDAEFPWRRHPVWLTLRVAVQRQLCLRLGNESGRVSYKFLICIVLAQLLRDCVGVLSPDLTLVLRAKLCRRLGKLEQEKQQVDEPLRASYQHFFDTVGIRCQNVVAAASEQINTAWENFKKVNRRKIPRLPFRAPDQSLHLSLPLSGHRLGNILQQRWADPAGTESLSIHLPRLEKTAAYEPSQLAARYFKLGALEAPAKDGNDTGKKTQDRCIETAQSILTLLEVKELRLDSFKPEHVSRLLLKAFELWIEVDKCAVSACPLVGEYNPLFHPEALDVLHLAELSSMHRLRRVQAYLKARKDGCKYPHQTILSEPQSDCFASRYVDGPQGASLRQLLAKIKTNSNAARDAKEDEWKRLCQKYDELSAKISIGTCTCTFNEDGSRNIKGCTKCFHYRTRRRMKITCHEDYLPAQTVQQLAVVFELGIPQFLQDYRNITWKILRQLGHPDKPASSPPAHMTLGEYSQLKRYLKTAPQGITLASVKKSFLKTHYNTQSLKVDLASVLLPLGLEFSYIDATSNVWATNLRHTVTFKHLCGLRIPKSLLEASIPNPTSPAWVAGPSSYDVVASQTKCPAQVSVHEFMALQRLLRGKNQLWMAILTELGSSNINFSDEESAHFVAQLAVQAGPSQCTNDVLRDAHIIFREQLFCHCLLEQISRRLRLIWTNWREVHCMELLITLAHRLHALAEGEARQQALRLIENAQSATLEWNSQLREKYQHAGDASEARRLAQYRFRAALLCRRTFAVFAEDESGSMSAGQLSAFIQASVSLQQSLVVDPIKLSDSLKSLLMRDMKAAHSIREKLRESIKNHVDHVGPAIWAARSSEPHGATCKRFESWTMLGAPDHSWIAAIMRNENHHFGLPQVVHYDYIEGHLLIDGQPLGRLPVDVMGSKDVRELFGDQHLLTFPSHLQGMDQMLVNFVQGNEVHFGRRGEDVIIQARGYDKNRPKTWTLLEYVPGRVFRNESGFDLPSELIDNCTHWLNIDTGELEIRRKPGIWISRPGNWILNVHTRTAERRGGSVLVDPHSETCRKVNDILGGLERPERMTVYQPPFARLSVELKRLELSFVVNSNMLLKCRQLRAEVDPNQDAGTLYGLESMLVVRDAIDNSRRSVIVALGNLLYQRRGMHVSVRVQDSHAYGKFEIDSILGRLVCPSEMRLLYSMALLHASTSFPIPDPLISSTGAEEAFRILSSGACQPWMPLTETQHGILMQIRGLGPVRTFYPPAKRLLQKVEWNGYLTTDIQQDFYGSLVGSLVDKSERLKTFYKQEKIHQVSGSDSNGKEKAQEASTRDTTPYLRERATIFRAVYQRSFADMLKSVGVEHNDPVRVYESRDRLAGSNPGKRVYQTAKLLFRPRFTVALPKARLVQLIESLGGNLIGGFHTTSDQRLASLDLLINTEIAEQLGAIVNFCRNINSHTIFDAVFRLGLLAFGSDTDMELIGFFCAFARLDSLKTIDPPDCPLFVDFANRADLSMSRIEELVLADLAPEIIPNVGKVQRRETTLEDGQGVPQWCLARSMAKRLFPQWPCPAPSMDLFRNEPLLQVDDMDSTAQPMKKLKQEWAQMHNNMQLAEYLDEVQSALNHHAGAPELSGPKPWRPSSGAFEGPTRGAVAPSLPRELLLKEAPADACGSTSCVAFSTSNAHSLGVASFDKVANSREVKELEQILAYFTRSSTLLWQQYGQDLRESLDALKQLPAPRQDNIQRPQLAEIEHSISATKKVISDTFLTISDALSADDGRFPWLSRGNLWPRTSPVSLLERLRSKDGIKFGTGMKEILVSYGLSIARLQWLMRVKQAHLSYDWKRLDEQLTEKGHENWDPMDFPDWLLLEIENNLLIRTEQIEVAKAIISPTWTVNSVLQLNMGKGKTSCIVPMAVAVLADSKQLCRLIVPKALLQQTAQTLQARIGGLLGREMRHVPFARRTSSAPDVQKIYLDLHRDILDNSGLILAIPENILSYKLSGLQQLADSRVNAAREMLAVQSWLSRMSRDVLDESDFTLAVKTQLIYPSGQLVPVDGHPQRWKVAQELLSLVRDNLPYASRRHPGGLEVVSRDPGFPMMYIVQREVEDELLQRLINTICDGHTPILQLPSATTATCRERLRHILTEEDPNSQVFANLAGDWAATPSLLVNALIVRGLLHKRILFLCLRKRWNVQYGLAATPSLLVNALIVRGLLLKRILFLCLRKRWNVQYGLHPERNPLAVPFEAKGMPSEHAEFGHPDVAIVFTCLSFYYAGLTLEQFEQDLGAVLKADDPAVEYDAWTAGCSALPESLAHWNLINVDDSGQVEALWTHLRLSRGVLDHYLNTIVFPRYAKQFAVKLQSSGWDLPLFSPDGRSPRARTTGFSGTNDNRRLLPLTIRQNDLASLKHTSAEVLACLLEERNRLCMIAIKGSTRLTEEQLLGRLREEKIRLLIDAGAYILEMDNHSLVKRWLGWDTEAKAGVYFGNDNRAWVQYRDGKNPVPLLATPFSDDMTECVVYLDEAHTRGTDLKLPASARGAVTLALGQTKDHTVQAAMRLRQLAMTQSITFCAPPEVYQSILDLRGKRAGSEIESPDVVHWLLEQTCRNNVQLQGLFKTQGIDFCHRKNASWQNPNFVSDKTQRVALVEAIKSPEQMTLDELYGATANKQGKDLPSNIHPSLSAIAEQLQTYQSSVEDKARSVQSSVMQEVEQEREVEFQVEEIRQAQKPRHYKGLAFPGLHSAIAAFAKTGRLTGDSGFEPASVLFAGTNLGREHNVREVQLRLFISAQFARTVDLGANKTDDNYLRPVEWVLWGPERETALVVIPEEAELLIPIIRVLDAAPVHLFPYAAPTTKNMVQSSKLASYVLPSPLDEPLPTWLAIELGLLGARLYFNFGEYAALLDSLDAVANSCSTVDSGAVYSFFLQWLSVRRKGQDVLHTPMGYVCQRRLLDRTHPFFGNSEPDANQEQVEV